MGMTRTTISAPARAWTTGCRASQETGIGSGSSAKKATMGRVCRGRNSDVFVVRDRKLGVPVAHPGVELHELDLALEGGAA